MNRNAINRFSKNPVNLDIKRSKFTRTKNYKTTFNVGELIPFYYSDKMPADTSKMETTLVARMSTFLKPVLDSLYLDTYYFAVPYRLVWDDFEKFMGDNKDGFWAVTENIQIPHIYCGLQSEAFPRHSLADYLGLPVVDESHNTNRALCHFDALKARSYYLIWNEYFRDENLQAPVYIPKTSEDFTITQYGDDYKGFPFTSTEDLYSSLQICRVNKFHDYFTSALPQPQKGPAVDIPVIADDIPVVAGSSLGDFLPNALSAGGSNGFVQVTDSSPAMGAYAPNQQVGLFGSGDGGNGIPLIAQTSRASWASINDLRIAFAMQRYYERSARGGTRYTEYIKSFYGVTSPDARLQRPEYLGGKRMQLNVSQVVQTSSSTEDSAQGNVTGYSLTSSNEYDYTKSFTEHCLIIGVCCVRAKHTYQQGVARDMSRRDVFDLYNPTFANIGEQPVYTKEIYAGLGVTEDEIFGYQESWAEYRYNYDNVTGEFRSNIPNTLDSWHFADYYEGKPVLSHSWIIEPSAYVDRTLAVSSTVSDQIICEFQMTETCVRPMPLYSVPGLIDHN